MKRLACRLPWQILAEGIRTLYSYDSNLLDYMPSRMLRRTNWTRLRHGVHRVRLREADGRGPEMMPSYSCFSPGVQSACGWDYRCSNTHLRPPE